jgi:hypothetical protein
MFSQGGKGAVLGVSDSKLSASINDGCGIKCSHIGVIPEVIRGNINILVWIQALSMGIASYDVVTRIMTQDYTIVS